MSDVDMEIDDHNRPETHQSGLPGYEPPLDESVVGETSGGEDSGHEDETELEEDPEALVDIEEDAILPQRIRQTDPVDYTSQEALEKAGLTREELEKKDEDDPEFVAPEDAQSDADVSMQ